MDYKSRYDIFITGHSRDFKRVREMLPLLRPYGTLHLASSFFAEWELGELARLCDFVHRPAHHPDNGYRNFSRFCVRDIDRIATAPWVIKVDADTELADGWIRYVDEATAAHPGAALIGPGVDPEFIDVSIFGPKAVERLGSHLDVRGKPKVVGGFYISRGDFYRANYGIMQAIHELAGERNERCVTVSGFNYRDSEDHARNMTAYFLGAPVLHVATDLVTLAGRTSVHDICHAHEEDIMKFRQFEIDPPLVVVFAEIPTDQLYPLVDHEVGYNKGHDKDYCAKIDRMVASVAQHGVIDPVIAHNRLDDGTFQVCIGCHRYLAAKKNGVPTVKCIVNCIEGQRHIPQGKRLESSEDVLACFRHPEPLSLCLEAIPNPGVLGWRAPGGFGDQAFDYGDGGTKGGVFCSPRRHTVDGDATPGGGDGG